jgi:hypothetical protein
MNKLRFAIGLLFISFASSLFAQENIAWKRTDETNQPEELHLFKSTQSFNLPTAETLQKGDFEFEISHRFIPSINTGIRRLYGIDGPVNMRLALGYALTDRLVVTLGRSNVNDNVDLWAKYKVLQFPNDVIPIVAALRAGVAWNTLVFEQSNGSERSSSDSRNFQYYGQLIVNGMIEKKLGIGIVPSYLYNSYIYTDEKKYSFTLGTNIEYYVSKLLGVIFEWNPTITGFRTAYNPVAFGIELNTGGHFFKILLTNSAQLNPSQFLAGEGDYSFNNSRDWRIGFNITRLLKF